jgi:DNA-binding IclR family transcriptional regulator
MALSAKGVQILRNMAADKSLTVSDICKTLGIGKTTFYRYVKEAQR